MQLETNLFCHDFIAAGEGLCAAVVIMTKRQETGNQPIKTSVRFGR